MFLKKFILSTRVLSPNKFYEEAQVELWLEWGWKPVSQCSTLPSPAAVAAPLVLHGTSRTLLSSLKTAYSGPSGQLGWGGVGDEASEKTLGRQREGLSSSRDNSKYNEVTQRNHAIFIMVA